MNEFNYIITVDQECDLSMCMCKKHNIIPLQTNYMIDYKIVKNALDFDEYKIVYKKIKEHSNFTNEENNVYTYMSFWHKLISLDKPIVHICSSLNKKNYESALLAKETIIEQYSNVMIQIVDSKNISLGCGILALCASELRAKKKTFEETIKWLEEYKLSVNNIFASSSRMSKPFNKKSVVKQIANGDLQEVNNTYSISKFERIIDSELNNNIIDPEEQTLYISSYDNKDAKICGETIKKRFGFKEVYYSQMTPTLISNFTQDTIALFFFGKKRI